MPIGFIILLNPFVSYSFVLLTQSGKQILPAVPTGRCPTPGAMLVGCRVAGAEGAFESKRACEESLSQRHGQGGCDVGGVQGIREHAEAQSICA